MFCLDQGKKYKVTEHLKVEGIQKDSFLGSFTVYLIVRDIEKEIPVWGIFDAKSILNRLERKNCLNCQSHEFAEVTFPFEQPEDPSLTKMQAGDLRLYVASMAKEDGSTKLTELKLKDLMNAKGCKFIIKVTECQ